VTFPEQRLLTPVVVVVVTATEPEHLAVLASVEMVEELLCQPTEQQTRVLVVVVLMAKEELTVDQVLSLFATLPPQTEQLT
jgi:hypothetical protein